MFQARRRRRMLASDDDASLSLMMCIAVHVLWAYGSSIVSDSQLMISCSSTAVVVLVAC